MLYEQEPSDQSAFEGGRTETPFHKNSVTSEFLNREDNSKNLLGKHWQDKTGLDRSKRCLLQSIGYKFPCVKLLNLRLWGLRESDECRLCKRLHPEVTPWPEYLGHIQARCPAFRKPRIAVHHGIWHELRTAISRKSAETHNDGERKWYFPSAVSEATHDKWTVRQILVHLGLFSGIRRLIEDVTTFHARQNIVLTSQEITSFYSRRPDGVAFDAKSKHCVFLESTRPMDLVTFPEGDWAQIKELEKNERYGIPFLFSFFVCVPVCVYPVCMCVRIWQFHVCRPMMTSSIQNQILDIDNKINKMKQMWNI